MLDETKYNSLLNIFSHSPYTLSSSDTYSASTLSRSLSSSNFNPLPLIHSLLYQLLFNLSSPHRAFLIADTTLLRKTGSKIEGLKKLYDPYLKKVIPAHKALILILWVDGLRIPLHVELLHNVKPVDALIEVLKKLLPFVKKLFPNLIFLSDAGLTCNRLLEFLLSEKVDFVCAISQGRVDQESGEKLRDLCFPKPEKVKLKGVSRPLYAYRLGEGTDKERVVVSNKWFSKKQFEMFYRYRWHVESEIRVFKANGLESYMVRKLRAIRLWIMAVWHIMLLKLRCKLDGIDFRRFLESLVFPDFVLALEELLELVKLAVRRSLRYSSFPDDRLVLLLLQNLIGGGSRHAKV